MLGGCEPDKTGLPFVIDAFPVGLIADGAGRDDLGWANDCEMGGSGGGPNIDGDINILIEGELFIDDGLILAVIVDVVELAVVFNGCLGSFTL